MKITLIHPPLDDPTLPYHSTAYLRGHLLKNGFTDVSMRDINIEFVNYCLEENNINAFYEEIERRLKRLTGQQELSYLEQLEFLGLWSSQRIDSGALTQAVKQLRHKDSFLDYPVYVASVKLLNRYFGSLGQLCFPAGISNFKQVSRINYSIYNLDDLFNPALGDKACYCFAQYFHERLTTDHELENTDCFGISVIYDHQLLHAVWFAQALKQRWPEKLVVFGGTCVSQCYKYLKDKSKLRRFFDACDAIIIGEGETALCAIADSGGNLNKPGIPNIVTYDRGRDQIRFPERIHYESVPALGPPVYDYPWHLYLSPERGINYSPTRGCYWNRCTFCDYGLNSDSPTSPWRERKIDQVIADLQQVIAQQQIGCVYFAVDVVAPGYLERLSDAIVAAGLNVRWCAELRMEKIFSPERCAKMAKAGCVCASFGMESGNQRVLDLIDKGTKVAYMSQTMKNFAEAGIAVQIMSFTGFPTETAAEKKATLDFVKTNKDYWSTGGIGTFVLTGTAMIARNPERFGIKLLETKNVDIARSLDYQINGGQNEKVLTTEDYDASFDNDRGIFPSVLGRPWAGGTDTLHSMIYYSAYGISFFKQYDLKTHHPKEALQDMDCCSLEVRANLVSSCFDISRILASKKLHKEHAKQLMESHCEPTYVDLLDWQAIAPRTPQVPDAYWIVNANKCMKLDKVMYDILTAACKKSMTVGEILAGFTGDARNRIVAYLEELQNGALVILDSGRTGRDCDHHVAPGPVMVGAEYFLPHQKAAM